MVKVSKRLKKIDMFGQGIKFTVKGQETYKTCSGAILTLLIYVIVLVYGSNRFQKFYQRQDTSHQQTRIQNRFDQG